MHGRLELSDEQAMRVLCAIDMYLEHADRIPPRGVRAVLKARKKIEDCREQILTKRIRAGLR